MYVVVSFQRQSPMFHASLYLHPYVLISQMNETEVVYGTPKAKSQGELEIPPQSLRRWILGESCCLIQSLAILRPS